MQPLPTVPFLRYSKNQMPAKALPYMQENMKLTSNQGNLSNHYIYTKAVFRLLTKDGKVAEALATSDYLFKLSDSISNLDQQQKLWNLNPNTRITLSKKKLKCSRLKIFVRSAAELIGSKISQ